MTEHENMRQKPIELKEKKEKRKIHYYTGIQQHTSVIDKSNRKKLCKGIDELNSSNNND